MARNIIVKHMIQNRASFEGFAFAFSRIFRRACRHYHRVQPCPFENAVDSFNAHAIALRIQ